jgi:hypothetical protein
MSKKVVVKPLPKVGSEPKKVGKFFLDSSRVRSTLFALLPVFVLLLKSIGIEADTVALQNLIEAITAVIGSVGSVYHLYLSYKKGDIVFFK